jgi:hypothetical protein
MKNIFLFTFCFVFVLFFTGKSFSQIPEGIYKIEGLWELNSDGMISYEQWKVNSDGSLQGVDFAFGTKGDTVYFESLEIIRRDNDVFYVASVMDQNERKPIFFKMTEWTRNVFVFENKEHDFPQKIIYYIKNDSQFNAVIEGPDKDKIKSIEFKFTKK